MKNNHGNAAITVLIVVLVGVGGWFIYDNFGKQMDKSMHDKDDKHALHDGHDKDDGEYEKKDDYDRDSSKKDGYKMMMDDMTVTEVTAKIENSDESPTVTALSDVTGGESTGESKILRDYGYLYHTVTATLPTPEEGFEYEGWLVNKSTGAFISTGVMVLNENGEYELGVCLDELHEGYNDIVITVEADVNDNIPEDHILEGTAE